MEGLTIRCKLIRKLELVILLMIDDESDETLWKFGDRGSTEKERRCNMVFTTLYEEM